ncbi:prolipoprotein diacylglyceryl transferase [Clostridium tepidiprofundi DSM 19306]|uniref:Phosphatidylglycerol--prolipoprotein diacylglyceryl transferase n=1 Tax=Clostridium tepidiprofundi DSM 19306 TaxID=1121338 RepID=A0A151B6E3_9CLOT|nr:prolipoprotein diacylglyceryl transferase [Clostridium tepidiprofundi]KYH35350.1 prolipoprotein diacylglyceryl transferase [Clostridium tepidiprofundi DSM 19306]
MNPIAFTIFGYDIRWYGIMISIGIIAGILLSIYSCSKKGVDNDILLNAVLLALPIGIIGARMYYVVFNWDYYSGDILRMINIRQGGLAIHGGIMFGILTAFFYFRSKKESFIKYLDAAAPSVVLAQAIGRWGNFFNQEAHGGPVSYEFIKHFPKFIQNGMNIGGVYYHPTFLYESIWDIVVCIILLLILKKNENRRDGMVIVSYLGLYSIGRFYIEGLRTDSLMLGSIRVAQLMSLIGISIWVIFIIVSFIRNKRLNSK